MGDRAARKFRTRGFSQRIQQCKQYGLILLFSLGLFCGLVADRAVSLSPEVQIADAATADWQMQQGVVDYQNGDFAAAIRLWQSALTLYRSQNNRPQTALTLENLARAYQAIGETDLELQSWQAAEAAYAQIGDRSRTGRMLSERAQAHSRIGQYRQAVALLCGELGPDNSSLSDVQSAILLQGCDSSSAIGILRSLTPADAAGMLTALGSLGDAYRFLGDANRAVISLEAGLAIADQAGQAESADRLPPAALTAIQISLGNAYLSLAQQAYRRAELSQQIRELEDAQTFQAEAAAFDQKALAHLTSGLTLARSQADAASELRSLLSLLPVLRRTGGSNQFDRAFESARSLLQNLPAQPQTVYAAIQLAQLQQQPGAAVLTPDWNCSAAEQPIALSAKLLLEQAVSIAARSENDRAVSFALGHLGHFYECQADFDRALDLTHQAQRAADQKLEAQDSLYLWQWQTGRILKQIGQPLEAIAAYEASLASLTAIRQDILTANRDLQFDFRESVEPVYRQLVALKLQQQPAGLQEIIEPIAGPTTNNLSSALQTLDSLRLAELQNYFGDDCVLTELNPIDRRFVDAPPTAIFSTAVLGDRVAAIVNIYKAEVNGRKVIQQFEWIKDQDGSYVDQSRLNETVNRYRSSLEQIRAAVPGARLGGYDPAFAARLYRWLIQPFEPLLQQQQIQTLVFVQDGILRSVPMSALYDGEEFLVQRYAIAMTPSLNLVNFDRLNRSGLRAIAVGLTEPAIVNRIAFDRLEYVDSELEAVQAVLPRSLVLQDAQFTLDRFQQTLAADTFPIIHIATHGRFSAEAANAFLVTGDNLMETQPKLTFNVLDDLIRQLNDRRPVELLVLSACQTATGDDRAALGLAGIAAQAGAQRVLASLWSVNDRATTELIRGFYQRLEDAQLGKAQILQAAQRSLIESGGQAAHPGYWAAFVLIGNWL